ncbi:pyridoxal phosphate-dependent aminotransferase [Actinomadura sp. HBU206391]|uniref:pyridoxal phosphate-dependent aminotransferase n=1 Tax=Actinomadura sp. HBU206391 TaxID=2731692 RepID=UPI0016502BA4|nr:aminotransferase class I/II-fold pyridoxal phosphate-dependent enzyme [Actinomadura sp. HBU206391]MBC6460623.1 aminotransferase class I/II-fold pyridoxal phosphate-dependent enzyme [Actinomadura sp. HBU206391]
MPSIAPHVDEMPRSGIRAIMDLAWQLTDPVIGLHVGEPSFPTAPHILEAVADAVLKGNTRYVPNAGLPALREAIGAKVRTRNGIDAADEQVIVTAGGMQGLHLALAAVVSAGDEVLVPDPGWPNFAMVVQLLQATPVRYELRAERGFQPDPEELARLVSPRTRAILVNSPANPLGAVTPEPLVRRLVGFAAEHDLWLVSDECYESFTFGVPHVSPAAYDTDGRVLSCFSFSKTYAMTGVRVGYLITPPRLAPVCAKLQEPLIACVNAGAQFGALAALTGPQDQVDEARETYQGRRDAAMALLDEAGVRYLRPEGAFYLWLDVADRCGDDVTDWAVRLLRDRGVAVAPGTTFGPGGEGWVRVCTATATDDLLEGLRRLVAYH